MIHSLPSNKIQSDFCLSLENSNLKNQKQKKSSTKKSKLENDLLIDDWLHK